MHQNTLALERIFASYQRLPEVVIFESLLFVLAVEQSTSTWHAYDASSGAGSSCSCPASKVNPIEFSLEEVMLSQTMWAPCLLEAKSYKLTLFGLQTFSELESLFENFNEVTSAEVKKLSFDDLVVLVRKLIHCAMLSEGLNEITPLNKEAYAEKHSLEYLSHSPRSSDIVDRFTEFNEATLQYLELSSSTVSSSPSNLVSIDFKPLLLVHGIKKLDQQSALRDETLEKLVKLYLLEIILSSKYVLSASIDKSTLLTERIYWLNPSELKLLESLGITNIKLLDLPLTRTAEDFNSLKTLTLLHLNKAKGSKYNTSHKSLVDQVLAPALASFQALGS